MISRINNIKQFVYVVDVQSLGCEAGTCFLSIIQLDWRIHWYEHAKN